MATITDNYVIVGASGDNFNCDSTSGWNTAGNAKAVATQSERVEGNYSLGLQTSGTGSSSWYHDISSSNRFKITEYDLGFWFFYIKGKGDNYLVQNGTAIVMRLYFGGTTKYADYQLTNTGDLELNFGWQMLMCSGTSLNGGSVGGGHNGDSDFNLDVYRIELILNAANTVDSNLGMDAFFIGNTIEVQSGTSSAPVTMTDLEDYTFNTRSSFPIGTVKITGKLVNIKSGISITNSGYLASENIYLLFNQLSKEVKHNINITNGTFRIGAKENSNAVRGCQIVKPLEYSADVTVGTNGSFEVYNSKFLNWLQITFSGSCDLLKVDFDTCDLVTFNSVNNNYESITVHDSQSNITSYSVAVLNSLTTATDALIYKNKEGIYIESNCSLTNLKLLDNTDYDIVVKDTYEPTLIDSVFNSLKRLS